MDGQNAGYGRFRRKLALGYGGLGLLLIVLLVWKTVAAYQTEREAAVAITAHSASAIAAHVTELIDAVEQPLTSSAQAIAALGEAPLTAELVRPMLATSRLSDSRYWLVFYDAAGRAVVSSNGLDVSKMSARGRAYFDVPAARQGAQLYVGAPRVGAVSGRQLFFLSRRVESASGRFLGVIVAPVDARRIADVFDSARIEPTMSIILATQDKQIIARAPLFAQSFATDLTPLIAASGATPLPAAGSFAATSPFQGDRRIFSYVPVAKYPLIVAVGVGRDALLRKLFTDFMVAALALALVLLAAFYSARLALAQYRRLGQVEAGQRKLIAELGAVSAELARGERRLRMITDHLPARVAYINVDERFIFHNSGCDGVGAPLGASMGKTVREVFGDTLYEELRHDIRRALAGEQVCVEHCCTVGGEERHFKRQYTPDIGANGRVNGFYSMVVDVTDFKQAQQRLAAIARVDSLTGLPNRAELLDRLENALARCRRTGFHMACLYLDIDRFKEVNDTLGHAGGDCALVEFGNRLRQAVRESDLVARLAGDEFVILLEGLEEESEARRVASKILVLMAPPFDIEGTQRQVSTSIGVVFADAARDTPGSLLQAADAALYQAKREGRNRIAIHRTERCGLLAAGAAGAAGT